MATAQVLFQYLTPGSHRVTIPAGFSNQLLVYAWGAGGGAGSSNAGNNGRAGGGGGFAQGIVTIAEGEVITVSVGTKGQNGPGGVGLIAQGGDGTNPIISLTGGSAGFSNAYNSGRGGPGGGGGGASALLVGGIPMVVAAGGGGAGGGGGTQTGTVGKAGGVDTKKNSTPRGQNSVASWATGGGGGAGYPLGGAAGISVASTGIPGGGYGGQNYANSLVASTSLIAGSNTLPGGRGLAIYPGRRRAYAGYDGSVIIIFTKSFQTFIKDSTWKEVTNAWVKASGAWKSITAGWIKTDGDWQPIQSGVNITPTRSASLPAQPVQVNITIAASTNNYVLSDFLSATSYYPGRSNIALTVNPSVIVSSSAVGAPALKINGLTSGDTVWLINGGTIQGRGGDGGTGGSYVTTGGVEYDSKGRPIFGSPAFGSSKGRSTTGRTTSIPGRPGGIGGIALRVEYPTRLVNNNIIAGGGGGGGGGGGPTGGQGGGGAGYGRGANNGTESTAGAGTGFGASGGARGTVGGTGTSDTNPGGVGGRAGVSISGTSRTTIVTTGTIAGPRQA